MTHTEREQRVESFGHAAQELADMVDQCPADAWDYRPAPGEWSIHEIVVHLGDSEMNAAVRIRQCIADPGQPIRPYSETKWAASLRYQEQEAADALQVFTALRQATYKLLKSTPDAIWANTTVHPERGTQTLDDLLTTSERHAWNHIEQVRNNYKAWLAQRK
ncbi:MAG TPA: DinB family protein [Anaerolineae bacterium]